jgi:hypothetical protein
MRPAVSARFNGTANEQTVNVGRRPARAADARERQYWDDYQSAFSEMLSNTSTEWAPWHVIPADHKWFARICVSAVLAHTLLDIDPRYPQVDKPRM